jgi:hypothetical protein
MLTELQDQKTYAAASTAALRRAKELDPARDYDAFELALENAIDNGAATAPPDKFWNGPAPIRKRAGRF